MVEPSNLEYTNLEVHVDKCSLRYEQMHNKLHDIDNRLDGLDHRLQSFDSHLKKNTTSIMVALIGATSTIIAAMVVVL